MEHRVGPAQLLTVGLQVVSTCRACKSELSVGDRVIKYESPRYGDQPDYAYLCSIQCLFVYDELRAAGVPE